ncbi:S-type anion channel SLAH4-like isoform X1 [Vicia villosa]|uniref:S-type anion channel SLAH4-like isoform X1 n=1 Tax=Vicia villosa TaxID=3911 RepID=UPI00273C6C6F|nr:S-type anion channel SLAH4-like isoform X1 [Vicia villosa]
MDEAAIKPTIDIIVCASMNNHHTSAKSSDDSISISNPKTKPSSHSESPPFLTKIHAGYFFISLSFGAQALLWKSLSEHNNESQTLWHGFNLMPSVAYLLLWCLAVVIATILSFLYMLKCILHFNAVKDEFSHHIGVNYMYTPWISYLLMLQSSPPSIVPRTCYYEFLCLSFSFVIFLLDVKLFGQWFTTKKRFLSVVANPVNLVSVIGNLVAAQVATEIGWNECALSMFSLGMVHYLVLFVTLYQRLTSNNQFPIVLRPAYFLYFAAPSMASLAWKSISGSFLISSKMLFFLSLFLFLSQACRPGLFKKTIKRLNVTWWIYSFPLTFLGLACAEYAHEVKSSMASGLMLLICIVSVLVFVFLMLSTVLKIEKLIHKKTPSK